MNAEETGRDRPSRDEESTLRQQPRLLNWDVLLRGGHQWWHPCDDPHGAAAKIAASLQPLPESLAGTT